ncbi:GNAT family N-acetyltransferase [Roseococcus sp. DSY-14]|uniref:GNAT family N-acetyltransferase n=1 Tax=Roseococcus sp. DSY-14 TaxID=3369650 RepID=UPI00387AD463
MSSAPRLTISDDDYPELEAVAAIQRGLHQFNQEMGGPYDREPVTVLARDEEEVVKGGLLGLTYWNWLFIDWLWLSREVRGQGLGTDLLARAEAVARGRGCTDAYTDTFSFTAPGFWRRNGWTEAGRLDGMPPGHSRIWYRKKL